MKQYCDRRPEMLQFLQPHMEETFKESCRQIQTEIEKNGHAIWDELKEKIYELLHHKNGEIKYFVCSFLRYSLYCERLEFYIHVMDEGFYLDEQEIGIYYCPQFLQESYLEDLNYLYKKATEKFMQIQKYELFDIKEEYTKYYYSIMHKMMESVSGLIMEVIAESCIPIADEFKIIYGEYMGNATILYTKGECGDEVLSDRNG
ncbi:MAG: hypothetical protein HDR71_04120 [Lachnospiraceae bacterium]|nr:hypothetical protein [Lachnospiraceae bacterium]